MMTSVAGLMPRHLPASDHLASAQHVVGVGLDLVAAGTAVDPVAPSADRVDQVVARAGCDPVGAEARPQLVVAGAAAQDVVARVALDVVGAVAAVDEIGATA